MESGESTITEDAALLASMRAGNEEAATRLSERYWPALYRFCLSYLADEPLAEDVTQETFAALSGTDNPPSGDVRPWLYKVARNRCLDILRRHDRSPTHHRPFRTGFDPSFSTAGPATRAANNERHEILRQVIASMPEEYRIVLMLKHIEGLSRIQIAEALEVSEPTIKGRLVRASEYLREELHKYSTA